MQFSQALQIVYQDRTLMARPVPEHGGESPYPDGIYFDEAHAWMWASGRKAGLPTPLLLFGDWEVILLKRHEKYNPAGYPSLGAWLDRKEKASCGTI